MHFLRYDALQRNVPGERIFPALHEAFIYAQECLLSFPWS
jgi:hypothetical protein